VKKNASVLKSSKRPSRESEAPNKYEHHTDIKSTPITPFKARKTVHCHSASCNWHDNLELLYVTGGSGTVRCGIKNIEMRPESIIIINSQTMHSISSVCGVDYYMYIIDNSFFCENGIDVSRYTFENVTTSAELRRLCLKVYVEAVAERDLLYNARLRAAFLELILELCTNHVLDETKSDTKSTGSEKYVKQAMEYINDNYTEKITLDGIAKVIGINKSYFAREFKKYAGQTVHTYINHLRCNRADRCLAEGMSVTEAALACGFETLSYFSRTYKKLRGGSPTTGKDMV